MYFQIVSFALATVPIHGRFGKLHPGSRILPTAEMGKLGPSSHEIMEAGTTHGPNWTWTLLPDSVSWLWDMGGTREQKNGGRSVLSAW